MMNMHDRTPYRIIRLHTSVNLTCSFRNRTVFPRVSDIQKRKLKDTLAVR